MDIIDRAIGVYESNRRNSLIRACNPFFLYWIGYRVHSGTSIFWRLEN